MSNILIAEDEKRMQDIIVEYIQRNGHTCITANNGMDAMAILKSTPIDLVVLDIMMPHLDGFSVCRIVREISNLPILFLTAKGDEDDKLRGYEYGADDYMTKPFSPKLLLAKINALLRRAAATSMDDAVSAGGITLVQTSHRVFSSGHEVELTHKEFELLHFFMHNQNQVFSRGQLLNQIWGYDFEGNTRTVDTHIKTLRQKLGHEGRHITTLIRSGYKFEVRL